MTPRTGHKLPRNSAPVLFAFIMSACLGAFLSFLITGLNTGFGSGFVQRWLRAYGMSFAFAFPSVTLLAPFVHRLVDRITTHQRT